jgi:uncharacterized protein (TIGR02300 family)
MAKADLGTKRACLSCGMRFYDFKRSPILCPGCGTEFDPENIIKNRKSRSNSKAANRADTDAGDDDQIETDETDALAETIVAGNDDDIDFDDDEVNEDADGPGIIQDDISDDDELLPSFDDKDDG